MGFTSFKKYNSKPKQTRKAWNKIPSGVGDLMTSAISRHNIGRQIISAMIVEKGNEILRNMLDMHMKADVKVLSYKQGQLIIACRHPAAVHAMQEYCTRLKERVEEALPTANIASVVCRTHPEVWTEQYGS